MKKKGKTVNLNNARVLEQVKVMEQIIADDVDPFSWDHIEKYHKRPILKKGEFWLVTENQWPYKDSKVQLLFIYKDNISTINNLPGDSFKELLELAQEFSEKYNILGGALGMRFGNTKYSGATVNHLHAQIISPQEGAQCTFWIGSQQKK